MIDRIILTKLGDPSQRAALAREVEDKLEGVPELQSVVVGLPHDDAASRSWDLSLVVSCADAAALARVLKGDEFREVFRLLETRGDCVKAWSFARTGG